MLVKPAHGDLAAQDLSFLSDTTRYLWPTDSGPYISSTFGETRAAHFHAGLDIRTFGREGYRVFATRDGVVHRLLIGPYGYGKMIQLKHDDGSYSLYAHLNRFEESIMAFADSIRLQEHRFTLDVRPETEKIRVRQGDLIAYTGSTGAGPPHLHFELHTPNGEPFNPLLTNLGVDDTLPPVFTGLAVEHLDPRTFHRTRLQTRQPQRRGSYTDFGSMRVSGPAGIAVNVHDRANRTPNVYAVHRLTLIHESDTLFHSRVDAYSYEHATQMFIDRSFSLLRQRRQGFQRLYLVNGNELPFYRTGPTRGVVDLPEGTHPIRIVAEDFYGNRSEARLRLIVEERERQPTGQIASIPAYPLDVLPDGQAAGRLQFFQIHPFHLALNGGGGGPHFEPSGSEPALYYRREEDSRKTTKKLTPGSRQFLHLPDRSIWVEFPEDALFDTLYAELQVSIRDSLPVIRLYPEDLPLRRPAQVNVILRGNNNTDRMPGLFSHDPRRNSYRFLARGKSGEVIRAPVSEFLELRFLHDDEPPRVGTPRVHRNLAGMQVVSVPVRDNLSGIDYERSRIEVNGERGITEYDPDRNRFIFYLPGFVANASNRVEVFAYDRMGNEAHRLFETIPSN